MFRFSFSKPALLSPDLPPGPRQHALDLVGDGVKAFTPSEIQRGLGAAYERLSFCGFDPAEAWSAVLDREHSHLVDTSAIQAWEEAEASALLAAAATHERLPQGVALVLKTR